jgi:drug/metabolite transporter (DMT)-like permease
MSDPARGRYAVMTLIQIVGIVDALIGLYLLARPPVPGAGVVGIGMLLSALVLIVIFPLMLARRWRSPPE